MNGGNQAAARRFSLVFLVATAPSQRESGVDWRESRGRPEQVRHSDEGILISELDETVILRGSVQGSVRGCDFLERKKATLSRAYCGFPIKARGALILPVIRVVDPFRGLHFVAAVVSGFCEVKSARISVAIDYLTPGLSRECWRDCSRGVAVAGVSRRKLLIRAVEEGIECFCLGSFVYRCASWRSWFEVFKFWNAVAGGLCGKKAGWTARPWWGLGGWLVVTKVECDCNLEDANFARRSI